MKKLPFSKQLNEIIFSVAHFSELVMSCFLTLVIIVLMVKMIITAPTNGILGMTSSEGFNEFLSIALNLVVGVEFVKMLCRHTPETVIEVLLFATARQMVVEHLEVQQILIGTLAIAILFATRKFFSGTPSEKKGPETDACNSKH